MGRMTPLAPHLPRRAAMLILAAMAIMGLVDNFVRVIAETAGLWQFQVIRSAMAITLLVGVARWRGWRLRPRRWAPVIARSAVLSVGLVLYFAALAVIPVSEAVAGLFTAPIWVMLLSVVVYRQRIGALRIGAAVLGFAGVLLVLRPDGGDASGMTLLPLISGVLYALAALATREWCGGETAQTLLVGFFTAMGLWGLVGLGVLSLIPVEDPPGPDGFALRLWGQMAPAAWFWTGAQAVGSLIAVGMIIRAYQIAEASYVAVFEYALLIFAALWGFLLLGQHIDGWALAGIAAILGSGAVIALRAPRPDPVS